MPHDIPNHEAHPPEGQSASEPVDTPKEPPDAEAVDKYSDPGTNPPDTPADEQAADDEEVADEDPGAEEDDQAAADERAAQEAAEQAAQARQAAAQEAGRAATSRTVEKPGGDKQEETAAEPPEPPADAEPGEEDDAADAGDDPDGANDGPSPAGDHEEAAGDGGDDAGGPEVTEDGEAPEEHGTDDESRVDNADRGTEDKEGDTGGEEDKDAGDDESGGEEVVGDGEESGGAEDREEVETEASEGPADGQVAEGPEAPAENGDDSEGTGEFMKHISLRDEEAVTALRHQLETTLEDEGLAASLVVYELRQNVERYVPGEDRDLTVMRTADGTLQIHYVGFGDVSQEAFDTVTEHLHPPTGTHEDLEAESGRGYQIIRALSTERGATRITDAEGRPIGVYMWINVAKP